MKKITNIIIHCSDSDFGSASLIRQWHQQNGWKEIGYHIVITNGLIVPNAGTWQKELYVPFMDGMVEIGRYLDGDDFISTNEIGAHALGYNETSAGFCLIGKKTFTPRQFVSLTNLLNFFLPLWNLPIGAVLGHYEVSSGRSCPNFDMRRFRLEYEAKMCFAFDGNVYVPKEFDQSQPIANGHENLYTKDQIQKRINFLLKNGGWNQEVTRLTAYRDGSKK
jgi:hypothetical protein